MSNVPVEELEELRNNINDSVTIESFAGVETGRTQTDKALMSVVDELDEIIGEHKDE